MSWMFVYLFPVAGPILGVLSGGIAVFARATLGYRRTAGYLRFLLSKVPGTAPDELGLGRLLLVEFAFYAVLGVVFLVSFFAVGLTVGFPSFYGALSYSQAAVRALTLFCLAFGVGTFSLVLFFTEADDRADYLGPASILGLLVGTVAFGVAARATLLMFAYPRTHYELNTRVTTRLAFGWVLDVLPLPVLATVAAVLFLVASIPRRLDTAFRPWHALLLLGMSGSFLPILELWLSVSGHLEPILTSNFTLMFRVQSLGVIALVLAGVEYNVEAFAASDE